MLQLLDGGLSPGASCWHLSSMDEAWPRRSGGLQELLQQLSIELSVIKGLVVGLDRSRRCCGCGNACLDCLLEGLLSGTGCWGLPVAGRTEYTGPVCPAEGCALDSFVGAAQQGSNLAAHALVQGAQVAAADDAARGQHCFAMPPADVAVHDLKPRRVFMFVQQCSPVGCDMITSGHADRVVLSSVT